LRSPSSLHRLGDGLGITVPLLPGRADEVIE